MRASGECGIRGGRILHTLRNGSAQYRLTYSALLPANLILFIQRPIPATSSPLGLHFFAFVQSPSTPRSRFLFKIVYPLKLPYFRSQFANIARSSRFTPPPTTFPYRRKYALTRAHLESNVRPVRGPQNAMEKKPARGHFHGRTEVAATSFRRNFSKITRCVPRDANRAYVSTSAGQISASPPNCEDTASNTRIEPEYIRN